MKLTSEWMVNELKRWRTGEWCTLCNAPQWVEPDGEHKCESIPTLQNHRYYQDEQIFKLKAAIKQINHYLNILTTHKDISEKDVAFKMAKATAEEALNE